MGFCALELAMAQRDPLWNPAEPRQWLGIVITLLVATAAISLVAGLCAIPLLRFRPKWLSSVSAKLICSFASCVILSKLVVVLADPNSLLLDVYMCLAFFALHCVYWVLHKSAVISIAQFSIVLAASFVAALGFLIANTTPFAPLRDQAPAYALVAGSLVLFANFITHRLARHRHALQRTALFALPVVAAIFASAVPSFMANKPAINAPPNVVLITCDAFRADYAETFGGHVPTPALSRLAARGTIYRQSYATAPWTTPSMYSILAGLYPPTTPKGLDKAAQLKQMTQYWLSDDERTLAERLAAKGYTTAALIGNPLLNQPSGILRGFQHQRATNHLTRRPRPFFRSLYLIRSIVSAHQPAWVTHDPIDSIKVLTAWAHSFLNNHSSKPFFLWIHFMDPHGPYNPPSAYRDETNALEWFSPMETPEFTALLEGNDNLAPSVREDIRQLYEGEVRYLDTRINELLDGLDVLDLTGNTYICLSADHGEEFWDHDRWGHGHSLYNELLHVPLIYSGPRIRRQEVTGEVSTIDIMPTLAAFTNIPPSATWQGRSRAAELWGVEDPTPSPVFAQGTTAYSGEPLQMVIANGYKLIRRAQSGTTHLFDLDADPAELTPINDDRVVADLLAHLDAWAASIENSTGPGEAITDEMAEQLKSMGYIE
jgi:arylsulfatase